MSFGQQDDEFLTIDLKELLLHKEFIKKHMIIPQMIPILTNYELKAGLVFQLSVVPFAYDVTVGDVYDDMISNEYQLCDHLEIDINCISGYEKLAFKSTDYKRVREFLNNIESHKH